MQSFLITDFLIYTVSIQPNCSVTTILLGAIIHLSSTFLKAFIYKKKYYINILYSTDELDISLSGLNALSILSSQQPF